jgi:ankyrin repeat protein
MEFLKLQHDITEGNDQVFQEVKILPEVINQAKEPADLTLLHLAASYGRPKIVSILLAKGADPTLKNKNHELASYLALFPSIAEGNHKKNDREAIFRQLAALTPESYANKNRDDETIFHAMAMHGFNDLIREALNMRPEGVFDKNYAGQLPVHVALLNPHENPEEMIKLLLPEAVANQADDKGWLPLHYAAAYGASGAVAEICIARTTNIDAEDREGQTPLMLARNNDNSFMVNALPSKHAEVHSPRMR